MAYTLAQAAVAAGRDRSSILRAIRAGKISATRDEATGAWVIEPSELHRLYPLVSAQGGEQGDAETRTADAAAEIRELRARLEAAETRIADKDAVITDLRQERDRLLSLHETDQRLLEDLRQKQPEPRRGWFGWLARSR